MCESGKREKMKVKHQKVIDRWPRVSGRPLALKAILTNVGGKALDCRVDHSFFQPAYY